MGLDMYLSGEKYFFRNWDNPEKDVKEDGFLLKTQILELGYWRKEPNLHGFIVQSFADGVDECQKIDLGEIEMLKIIEAVKENRLPHTEGFFFGRSANRNDPQEREYAEKFEKETVEIFEAAIKWMKGEAKGECRTVYYQASW